jgi:hypothetical protein
MAFGSNYDYDLEKAKLDKKRQMLEGIAMGSLKPMEMPTAGPGQTQAKMGWAQALAPIAQAFLAAKGMKGVDSQQADLSGRYKEDLVKGMGNYMDTMNGKTEMLPNQGPMPDGSAVQGEFPQQTQAPDHRKAILDAIASNHPVLQQMGMAQLAQMGKDRLSMKDILTLPDFDAKARLAAAQSGDISQLKPKMSEHVVNNQIVAGTPGDGFKGVGDFRDKFGPLTDVRGDVYQQEQGTGAYKKLDNAPKVNVHNVVNTGDDAFMKKLGTDTASMVGEARKAKQNGEQGMLIAGKLEDLNNKGVFSGPTANVATTLGTFADTVGIPVDQNKLTNSQEYQGTIAKQVSKVLMDGSVGRSMTDEDRKAWTAQFPQLVNTPEGRQRIIALMRQGAQQDIDYHSKVDEALRKNYPDAHKLFNVAPSNVRYGGVGGGEGPTTSNW